MCLLSQFGHEYLAFHGFDPVRLSSPKSLACLAAIAESGKCDTANVECIHSYWQREARARGLQTISDSVVAISSTVMLHTTRGAETEFRYKPETARKLGRPRKPRVPKRAVNPKRKRLC